MEEYFSKVYLAQDGKEALEIYYDKKPDVLLLDISMPLMDGLEVAKAIRKKDDKTPIVMLTAHSQQEKLMRAVTLKLTEYLLKPIDNKSLQEKILEAINKLQKSNLLYLSEGLTWNKTSSYLSCLDKVIKLTKKESILMQLLANNSAGDYLSRDTLIFSIWSDEMPDSSHDHKLTQLIYRFNKKITQHTNSTMLLVENSYQLGYKLSIPKNSS